MDQPIIPNQAHVRYTAADYDRYTRDFVRPYDEMLAGWVLQRAKKLPRSFVLLDVGTGTARFLIHLAGLPGLSEARLVGTDVFQDMLDVAGSAVREAGFAGRIELLLEDVHDMKLPSEFADLIVSRSTLHHWVQSPFPNPVPRALQEIHRVLKSGGEALIVDVRRDAPPDAVDAFNKLRGRAGISDSVTAEKFVAAQVKDFAEAAGLGACSKVDIGTSGLAALGLALTISKF
jgi:ubiquinone/menaquinone biosynthesis C-methylase UbiE